MSTVVRLVVFGSGGVGKSALSIMFVNGIYVTKYDPTIEDSYRKTIEIDNKNIMIEILDTAGTEQFTSIRDMYCRQSDGFFLVFSVISRSTFVDIQDLYENILRVKDVTSGRDLPILLVGNKADVNERQIVRSEAERTAEKLGVDYMETSAALNINVEQSFMKLTEKVLKMVKGIHPKKKKNNCLNS